MEVAIKEGFEKNSSGRRAYRIGIDASLWITHSMHMEMTGKNAKKHGEQKDFGTNSTLRTLLWKVARLLRLPVILLFVLDGRQRPKVKRGSKKGKSGSHEGSRDLKTLLDVFGVEWREVSAPYICTSTDNSSRRHARPKAKRKLSWRI
jgi:Holliday junction resolvase YEN1